MLKTIVHPEVLSGSQINITSIPFPPVNDKIRSLIIISKTTGGEGTPAVPVPTVSTPSGFKLISCGKNILAMPDNVALTTYTNGGVTRSIKIENQVITINGNMAGATSYTLALIFTSAGYLITNSHLTTPTLTGGILMRAGTTYKFSRTVVSGTKSDTSYPYVVLYHADETTEGYFYDSNASKTYTPTANVVAIKIGSAAVNYVNYAVKYQLELGSTATAYTAFNGVIYPYLIEDTQETPVSHEGNDLPDGTADSYDRDNFLFTQLSEKVILDGVTQEWTLGTVDANYTTFTTPLLTGGISLRCSHFKTIVTDNNLISCDGTTLTVQINTTILPTQTVEGFNTWLAANNVTVLYELAIPLTFPIKPYNADTFAYNQIPMSVQYINNIYTDAAIAPTIQCEIRKLGNRAIASYTTLDSDGEIILDENDEQILTEV